MVGYFSSEGFMTTSICQECNRHTDSALRQGWTWRPARFMPNFFFCGSILIFNVWVTILLYSTILLVEIYIQTVETQPKCSVVKTFILNPSIRQAVHKIPQGHALLLKDLVPIGLPSFSFIYAWEKRKTAKGC